MDLNMIFTITKCFFGNLMSISSAHPQVLCEPRVPRRTPVSESGIGELTWISVASRWA